MGKVFEDNLGFSLVDEVVKNIADLTYEENDIQVTCEPIVEPKIYMEDGTQYFNLKVNFHVTDKSDNSTVGILVDILKVPNKTALGYVYHDGYVQVLDKYNRARGWVFSQHKNTDKVILISNDFNQKLTITENSDGTFRLNYARKTSSTDKDNKVTSKVDLGVFIRAIFDMNLDSILDKFPKENYVIQNVFAAAKKMSMVACIDATADAVLGTAGRKFSSIYKKLAIHRKLFNTLGVNLGFNYSHTFKLLQSFSARAIGKMLAENVEIDDEVFEKGTTLTPAILEKIDASEINELKVDFNGTTYTLHKFYHEENSNVLSEDMFLTVLDIISNNAMGYDYYGSEYDVSNRVLVSVPYIVGDCALANVQACIRYIMEKVDAQNIFRLPIGFDPNIRVNTVMESIFNTANIASQQADLTNTLSSESQSGKVTTTNSSSSVSAESVQVQDTQEGRFDAFDVPESIKIGRVHRKCLLTKTNELGEIVSPYCVVKDGVVTDEVVYLSAAEENNKYIADWNETFVNVDGSKKKSTLARFNGNIVTIDVDSIMYKECSAYQDMSIAHACVPFPGHSNGKRITMACNEYRQAVVTTRHERPYVNAGGESMLSSAYVTARDILQFNGIDRECDIECIGSSTELNSRTYEFKLLDDSHTVIKYSTQYNMIGSCNNLFSFQLRVTDDMTYAPDDIVIHNISYDAQESEVDVHGDMGEHKFDKEIFKTGLALANNVNVVIKTCDGSTIDDACVISDRLIADDQMTHVFISRITATVSGDNQMFGCITADEKMTEMGVPEIGTWLCVGDPVICKLYIDEAGNRTNHFIRLGLGRGGQVINYSFYEKNGENCVDVYVACRSIVELGDKFAGRHGNKTVVAKILPAELMPYNPKTGFTADICINPLGIPSRQNISQLLDIPLSYCMKKEGKRCVVAPYNTNDNDFVEQKMREHGVDEEYFVDGRTGFYYDRPCFYGVMSLLKLHHVVRSKEHAVGFDASVAPITLQPNKGAKMNGGQVIGEMEAWCLCSVGASNLVQEFYSFRSDDIKSKESARKMLEYGKILSDLKSENHNDMALQAFYLTLGISVEVDKGNILAKPVTDKIIRALSPTPITSKNQLHSDLIFGRNSSVLDKDRNRNVWSYIELNTKIVSPLYLYNGLLNGTLLPDKVRCEQILKGQQLVNYDNVNLVNDEGKYGGVITQGEYAELSEEQQSNYHSGMDALVYLLEHYNGNVSIAWEKSAPERKINAQNFYQHNKLSDLVISTFPVIPELYRYEMNSGAGRPITSDFDWFYRSILAAAYNAKERPSADSSQKVFDAIEDFLGLSKNRKISKRTLVAYFAGKDSKGHGALREEQQSKRIVCAGRTTIIPSANMKMDMKHIGVPYASSVRIWYSVIAGYLNTHYLVEEGQRVNWTGVLTALAENDHRQFNKKLSEIRVALKLDTANAWEILDRDVRNVIEGNVELGLDPQVVVAGRQPTLHRYGIRAFYPTVVRGRALQIHPLVCGGYNADFDGDSMWYAAALLEESKNEAISLLSAAQDIINPKDSSLIINHSQDMALGMFFATMLPNNASSIDVDFNSVVRCQSVAELQMLVDSRSVDLHDVVSVKVGQYYYASTAGRILFNSIMPNRLVGMDGNIGFTNKPFTNCLGIKGIDTKLYRDLSYDGNISCGKLKGGSFRDGGPKSIALSQVNRDIYDAYGEDSLMYFQAIMEFGFTYADRSGVSLGFKDLNLKFDTQEILKESNDTKTQLELDYNEGLLTEEDKIEAVTKLFTDDTNPTGPIVKMRNMINNSIAPDNNINIIMNSGARGNATQLMHMCGMLGVLQKDSSTLMETPVVNNYTKGLSAFDVHITSYPTRTGLASTQLETGDAGYATRQAVCIESGLQVVDEDCHTQDTFNLTWGTLKEESCKFIPGDTWVGRKVISTGNAIKDAEICTRFGISSLPHTLTMDNILACQLAEKGFHRLDFEDGSYEFRMSELVGKRLTGGKGAVLYCKNFLQGGCLTEKCLKILRRHTVKSVVTEDGEYQLCYHLDPSLRSMLLNRVVTGVYSWDPLLHEIKDTEENRALYLKPNGTLNAVNVADSLNVTQGLKTETLMISNDAVLDVIEDGEREDADIRTLLTCKSKGGVCAKCYGIKFSKRVLPKKLEYLGYESAHALSADVTQLTISLINKGGAGAGVSSGVDIFKNLLNNSVPKSDEPAVTAPVSGYVNLFSKGDRQRIVITPEEETGTICAACKSMHGVTGKCTKAMKRKYCHETSLRAALKSNILYEDGEYVKVGDLLVADSTMRFSAMKQNISMDSCLVSPNALDDGVCGKRWHSVTNVCDVQQARRMQVILNYYRTFDLNDLHPNARHFEVLAHIQTNYVSVDGNVTDFNSRKNDNVTFRLPNRGELAMRNSGLLTAAVFEDVVRTMGGAVVNGYVSSAEKNNSPISLIANGADLRTGRLKQFAKHNHTEQKEQQIRNQTPYSVIERAAPVSMGAIDTSAFDVFNSLAKSNLFGAEEIEPPMEENVTVDTDIDLDTIMSETAESNVFESTEEYAEIDSIDNLDVALDESIPDSVFEPTTFDPTVLDATDMFGVAEDLDEGLDDFAAPAEDSDRGHAEGSNIFGGMNVSEGFDDFE